MGGRELKPRRRERLLQWLLGGAGLLCVLIVLLVLLWPGMNPHAYAPNAFYLLQPESCTEVPAENGLVTTCYTFTVPEGAKVRHGARLCVYLQHCYAKVWLDDALQYTSWEDDSFHIGKTPGNYWLTAAMRSDYSGKVMRIEITPVYGGPLALKTRWLMPLPAAAVPGQPQFLLIDHEQLLSQLIFPRDAAVLIIGFFVLIIGVFLSLFSVFARLDREDRERLFRLGTLAVAAALWNLSQLPSLLLALDIYGQQKTLWYLGACAFALEPVLMLRFLNRLQKPEQEQKSRIAFGVCLGTAILLLLLQLLNVLDLYLTLLWHGLLGLLLLVVCQFPLSGRSRRELLWQLPFVPALGADLLIILCTGSARFAVLSLLWVTLNLCIRGSGFVSDAFLREQKLRQQEKDLYEMRLRSLSQQIRPHFIYNTLSSIYVLCKNGSPRTLPVIEDFLTYLQANYTAVSSEKPVAFSVELQHTKAYLAVEAVRFEGLLEVEYDTPHTAFRLPPLTLQPIVENAVKHGMRREHVQLNITVRTRKTPEGSRILVEDNGPGFDAVPEETAPPAAASVLSGVEETDAGIGLQNVRNRLRILCDGSLEIASRPEGGTVVTIDIPDRN